ncbi:DsbA family protein [Deinococcus xianganensis]|uniref:Thioredoxin domain-containing protein n=1 Tax=Deinococcus xianganensis TaxID=1507289 RepID=A0A6I4YKP0_9DEIO|nr:thioredoxin domain-containing protein [Deinococcus xianganensis]MXV18095.1 thioredoxin domain-containing protein [Deinococcus xianganensis]
MTANSNPNRMFLVIGTLIAAVLIGLAVFAVQGKPAAGTATFDLKGVPFAGQESAPVDVVVVEDFKCPACKNFEETVTPELKTRYVDTGKAKVHTILWPFLAEKFSLPTDDGKLAAQASLCVYDQGGNDAFTTFKSILFRAQGEENVVWATKARLKDLAGNLESLDQSKFAACLDSDATAARVDAMEAQATRARVNSTPTVFVNGKQVTGTLADIGAAIDAAK